jgi:hypothetical protein
MYKLINRSILTCTVPYFRRNLHPVQGGSIMKQKNIFYLLIISTWILLVGCSASEGAVTGTAVPTIVPTVEPTPGPTLGQSLDPNSSGLPAARAAALVLAADLNVDPSLLVIESITSITWPDGCLGVHRMGVLCTKVVSDGYIITFSMNGRYYQTNSNGDGSSLVQVPGAIAPSGGVAVSTQDGDSCTSFILSDTQGVQSGPCDGSLTSYALSSDIPDAAQRLLDFANMYAPFHIVSPMGTINFNGYGSATADYPAQRQIGEMALWMANAAIAGQIDPTSQVVINWQRDGGIAGFCDGLTVYSYGLALGTSCKWDVNSAAGEQWFSLDQLGQLYDWNEQFSSFDYYQGDAPGVTDAMTNTVHFNGLGFSEAGDADKRAVADFASMLFAQFTANAPVPAVCTLTAQADVTVYQRPSTQASQFGTLATGDMAQAMMRTADGWLGFDPGTAQAANVGVFRLRWVAPDAAVLQTGDCSGLSVAPAISPTACYFMAMADTAVYTTPDATSAVLATIPAEGYTAVTGQTAAGWYQLDLQDGSLAQPGSGWLNPTDANFNGSCDALPAVTP